MGILIFSTGCPLLVLRRIVGMVCCLLLLKGFQASKMSGHVTVPLAPLHSVSNGIPHYGRAAAYTGRGMQQLTIHCT